MITRAVGLALVTMVAWGGWAVFAKLATATLRPETAMIISYIVGATAAVTYVVFSDIPVDPVQGGAGFAILAGLASAVGAIALYSGLKHGDASIVTTISALYFVVAAIVSVFVFNSSLATTDVAGIGFAVIAIVLLTT